MGRLRRLYGNCFHITSAIFPYNLRNLLGNFPHIIPFFFLTASLTRETFPNSVDEDYYGKVVDHGDPTHLQPHELGRGGDGLLHLTGSTGVHEDDLDTPENSSSFSNDIIDLDFPK